jgi:predicted Fe-Mo cluster-binding NifX family protein
MITKGVKSVVTGNVGPNAFGVLPDGIVVYLIMAGMVREVIENFMPGKFAKTDSPGPGKQFKMNP